ATSYLVHGNQLSAADLPSPKTVDHWFNLSGVDVDAQGDALVTLGDSITDGHGATTNGNDRWPDLLTQRLGQQNISVLNVGIGGNRVLLDGLGPNSAARFTRDVLAQSHAHYVIVFEGVNDLGTSTREAPISPEEHAALVQRIESAYAQMIQEAHDHGLTIIGATITPYGGSDYYHPDQSNESDRQAINAWIRAPGHFDEVVDFDAAVRDDQRPDHLRAQYDTGDHLHPSVAGYRAMIDAIPPNLFMQVAKPAPHRHHGRRHRKT
ncbi:MAG: SGNH/GDSL hydrolase family protein, partial [Asticcacaulis sp.]